MFPMTRTERAALREGNPLALFRENFDSLWNRFLNEWNAPEEFSRMLPTWNWEETEKEFVLHAPMPGFAPEEIELNLTGDEFSVKAEHREVAKGKTEKNGHRERYGRVERRLTLPVGVDAEKVAANCKNGMLEVHFPRRPDAAPRRIEVTT